MTDIKKSADELSRKAAFAAAKDAAERAISDALLSDEERAEKKAAEAQAASRKRKKWLALGIVGLLLVLGVVGLVISYWQWFLLAGLVGLGLLYARYRLRKYWAARKKPAATTAAAAEVELVGKVEKRVALPAVPVRVAPVAPAPPEIDDQAIDDELAALKARVKK